MGRLLALQRSMGGSLHSLLDLAARAFMLELPMVACGSLVMMEYTGLLSTIIPPPLVSGQAWTQIHFLWVPSQYNS